MIGDHSLIQKEIDFHFKNILHRNASLRDLEYYLSLLQMGNVHISDIPKLIRSSEEYGFFKKHEKKLLEFKDHNDNLLQSELKKQQLLGNHNAISFVDVNKIAYSNNPAFTERFTEYFLILKNLDTKGKLLDIGCVDSLLATELSKIKTLEVYGIDIRQQNKVPYKFFVESAVKTHFDSHYFDQITIVSTIEHFGLDVYENKILDNNADQKAMHEIKRILKKDGYLLLTTPFGKDLHNTNYKTYDVNLLQNLFDAYHILEKQYFYQTDHGWEETDVNTASKIGHAKYYFGTPLPGAIVYVKAQPKY